MQEQLTDILDNILGLLLLEGSYEIEEEPEGFKVMIDTPDAGKLIGFKGESLSALQLLINQMVAKQTEGDFKRVIIDVSGWRENKEQELRQKATNWVTEVIESGQSKELEPMPSWQRRVVHMVVQETEGVESESVGEGRDRHLVISPSKQG